MKALEKLLKKYEIQLMNLKENKVLSLPEDEYPYNFDINRTKGFIADLKRVLAKQPDTESKLNIGVVSLVERSGTTVCDECNEPHRHDKNTNEQICLNCGNGWQTGS